MRRKHLLTALVCAAILSAASVMPTAVLASETEAVTEAVTDAEETEEVSEEESEAAPLEYPEYTASDYVKLGEYKGLVVVPEATDATEEEIEAEIQAYIQMYGELDVLTEGTVIEGDKVIIDYEGKRDGVAFDGGTAKDADLVIGSNTFIDGFEDGLIGVSVGETVDLNLTFPENYFNSDLAGAEVVFTVTVNEIQRAPELTDELINTISEGEYADVAAFRAYLKESIESYKTSMRDSDILSKILTMVADNSEILDYPQVMVDYGVENMLSFYKDYAQQYEMEYADFILSFMGMSEDTFYEQAVLAVKQNLQQELYLKAIAEAESITITDEEYEEGCAAYAESYGYASPELLVAEYGEDMVRASVLQEKVLDFLVENAVIEEPQAETETEAVTE